ncbi:MAG: response regulator transcription factor [Nitrospirae bacterium]|nr:response regulator transcription factor [Nitrospirota bacterium]
MKRPRIILADDHRMFAEGLKRLLEPDYEIVAMVDDGKELVATVAEIPADLILVDISMPGLNGIEAARQIIESNRDAKIILLTMHDEVTYVTTALDAGVRGYVLKQAAPSELLAAIKEVLKGSVYVSPSLASQVLYSRRKGDSNQPPTIRLQPRQREILRLLAEGKTAKEIAAHLHLTRKTIEYHKSRIMLQLNVQTSAQLIHYAVKHGISSV